MWLGHVKILTSCHSQWSELSFLLCHEGHGQVQLNFHYVPYPTFPIPIFFLSPLFLELKKLSVGLT